MTEGHRSGRDPFIRTHPEQQYSPNWTGELPPQLVLGLLPILLVVTMLLALPLPQQIRMRRNVMVGRMRFHALRLGPMPMRLRGSLHVHGLLRRFLRCGLLHRCRLARCLHWCLRLCIRTRCLLASRLLGRHPILLPLRIPPAPRKLPRLTILDTPSFQCTPTAALALVFCHERRQWASIPPCLFARQLCDDRCRSRKSSRPGSESLENASRLALSPASARDRTPLPALHVFASRGQVAQIPRPNFQRTPAGHSSA